MTNQPVRLPGPIALVPTKKVLERLVQDGLPDPTQLATELTALSQQGALPARFEPHQDVQRLLVYLNSCVAWLRLSRDRDAYSLVNVARRRLRDHSTLAMGALLIHSTSDWQAYSTFGHFAQTKAGGVPFNAHWDLLWDAWQQVQPAAVAEAKQMPPHHAQFLDMLRELVVADRDIKRRQIESSKPWLYRQCLAAREKRYSARGVYDFVLVGPETIPVKTQVEVLGHETQLHGKVVGCTGLTVTVRFRDTVDFRSIPQQGTLRESFSDRTYRAQLDAIELLAGAESANPRLLSVLVDAQLTPYRRRTHPAPDLALDSVQEDAYRRALDVRDMLLVHGPPGTGKTRTITAIVKACKRSGQRVLLASHTNRAVDNVLAQIPEDVLAMRVGNESALTSLGREYRPEAQVRAWQLEIERDTAGLLARLTAVLHDPDPGRWLDYLAQNVAALDAAKRDGATAEAARQAAIANVTRPLQLEIDAAGARLLQLDTQIPRLSAMLGRRRRLVTWLSARSGVIGLATRWLLPIISRWAARLEVELVDRRDERATQQCAMDTAQDRMRALVAADPYVAKHQAQAAAARDAASSALDQARLASGKLRDSLARATTLRVAAPVANGAWAAELTRLRRAVDEIRQRAELLTQWRTRIPQAGDELQSELVRYADVVAATCIGTATSELVTGIAFDVAIIDEAGQISLPNLIVPLVRVKRAILVGDHMQLPPYAEEELLQWFQKAEVKERMTKQGSENIPDLVKKSAFELLHDKFDGEHRRMLRIQRRMPAQLADFVSRTFYGGGLETMHAGNSRPDPIFRSPLAMIDTSDLLPGERREKGCYFNDCEAQLIADLMVCYARQYPEWAVIVPYAEQVEHIRKRLMEKPGLGDGVEERVGTVDSFQGGEKDLIVYGFTRSNSRRAVGFLAELRRLNVAITRARKQLILVGDNQTLMKADNTEFRDVMVKLAGQLNDVGDLRMSGQFRAALPALGRD